MSIVLVLGANHGIGGVVIIVIGGRVQSVALFVDYGGRYPRLDAVHRMYAGAVSVFAAR